MICSRTEQYRAEYQRTEPGKRRISILSRKQWEKQPQISTKTSSRVKWRTLFEKCKVMCMKNVIWKRCKNKIKWSSDNKSNKSQWISFEDKLRKDNTCYKLLIETNKDWEILSNLSIIWWSKPWSASITTRWDFFLIKWKNNARLVFSTLASDNNRWHLIPMMMISKKISKIPSKIWSMLLRVFIEFQQKLKEVILQNKNLKDSQILAVLFLNRFSLIESELKWTNQLEKTSM